jgi:hypothetical protein
LPTGIVRTPDDPCPDLALVIEAWATFPDPIKAGIVAMVKAVTPRGE